MDIQPLNRPVILRKRLDKIRREANQLARHDSGNDGPSWNPYRMVGHKRHTRSNSMQLESGLAHTRSLGDLSADQDRRQEMNDGINVPEYSNTFPPEESAGIDHEVHKSPPEPSMASQDPINVSRGVDSDTLGSAQTRQRKGGILGKLKHRHDDDEDKKSLEKQTFTFGGQLRATILNSWINVLLIAAPVGSMFYFFC